MRLLRRLDRDDLREGDVDPMTQLLKNEMMMSQLLRYVSTSLPRHELPMSTATDLRPADVEAWRLWDEITRIRWSIVDGRGGQRELMTAMERYRPHAERLRDEMIVRGLMEALEALRDKT